MEYTIESGDTLTSIARRYDTTVAAILALNPALGNGNRIQVGQVLRIPQSESHRRPATGGVGRPTQGSTPPQVHSFLDTFFADFPQPFPMSFLQDLVANAQRSMQEAIRAENRTPWMDTALGEVGVAEHAGMHNANPRILEYFQASRYWGTDDTSAENAWCGSFVAWVMQQHGYAPVRAAFRARAWSAFGKRIATPVYGAIGIKSRTGGGHVSFVMGRNEGSDRLFMLGGNQGNRVRVSNYPRDVWTTFVVPQDFDETQGELPLYDAESAAAGSEA